MSNSITTPNETFGQSESTQAFAKLPKVFFDENYIEKEKNNEIR